MAARLKRVNFLSPFVSEKLVKRLQNRFKNLSQVQESTESLKSGKATGKDGSKSGLAVTQKAESTLNPKLSTVNWYRREKAVLKIDSIYKTLPNAQRALVGATPTPRFIWKEKEYPTGFPDSPEEAKTDVMTYLEQKDCYNRMKKLKVKDFCVGSIVAVTRADPYIPKGRVRFVGICIAKNHWQNTLGATFTLRNVIDGEPMEVNFQLYSPLIQRIEVLKHQRRHREALWYLRDYPPSNSYVSETMKAVPYTDTPSLYVPLEVEKQKVKKWFQQIYLKKKRR